MKIRLTMEVEDTGVAEDIRATLSYMGNNVHVDYLEEPMQDWLCLPRRRVESFAGRARHRTVH